jgi:integrase
MASIKKRPDGKWRARWREYPGGPEKSQHFGRKADAEAFLVGIQHKLLSGTYTPPAAGKITVQEYAEEWTQRRTWAPSTEERIERELRLHILPTFGPYQLAGIRREHIEKWANALTLAPSSVRTMFDTFSGLLATAVDDGRIPVNPAKGARLPDVAPPDFVPLTVPEVRRLASAAPEHLRAAVVFAAGTGVRQGELFGLRRTAINVGRREVRIDTQLWTPAKGAPVLKRPKESVVRTIAVGSVVLDALAVHLDAFGTGDDGLVFRQRNDKPMVRSEAGKVMRAMRRPSRVLGAHWHDLRHHHATVLLSNGVSPALVAERLGHTVETLLATYAHVVREDDERVRAIVDATLGEPTADFSRTRVA